VPKYALVNALFVCSNVGMARKSKKRPLSKDKNFPNESLRILASLIAQYHIKKITGRRKPDIQSADNGDLDNG
jgi:hypothetical protein